MRKTREREREKGNHCNFDESRGFNHIVKPRRRCHRCHDSASLYHSICFSRNCGKKKKKKTDMNRNGAVSVNPLDTRVSHFSLLCYNLI